jgi:SAM-dependent methyltransferase
MAASIFMQFSYMGTELEVFAKATNWKNYVSKKLRPYITGSVIEVGAGLGSSTKYLCDRTHVRWLCLDPDANHSSHLKSLIAAGKLPPCCEARCGVLADLDRSDVADTILYVDVLEHIQDDEAEMLIAAAHLAPGGHIVVLGPAFNSISSPLDKAVGHYRRYERDDATRLSSQSLSLQATFFLDSAGFFASASNRLILRKSLPSARDIKIWDKLIVPVSILTDKILGSFFGRSIVMVWRKNPVGNYG